MTAVGSVGEASDIAVKTPPAYAVLDLRLEDGSGLSVVEALNKHRPDARVVILTGYGAIATAVAAVKAGAIDYLAKPADPEDIVKALLAAPDATPEPPDNPMSADRIRWEHIQRVLSDCSGNITQATKLLGIHRRSLQRKLAKYPPGR